MKFDNIQNKPYDTQDGIIWNSRSVAIVGHIYCIVNNEIFVLIGKRGPKGDMPGKWNLPCGYLDWNETLAQALFREIWEETGLELLNHLTHTVGNIDYSQPYFVNSNPGENRQNVAMHMLFAFKADQLPVLTTENAEEGEVECVEWINPVILMKELEPRDFAFNHLQRINNSYFNLLEKL